MSEQQNQSPDGPLQETEEGQQTKLKGGGASRKTTTKAKTLPDQGPSVARLEEAEYGDEEYRKMLDLYDETLRNIQEGEIVRGKVLAVTAAEVLVDIGFKSEGSIPVEEFGDPPDVSVGDEIEVFLENVEDQEGQIVLSKQKADFMKVWENIRQAHDAGEVVQGRLVRRIKGGIVVDLFGVDAFLPGSQIDIRQVKNFDQFIGRTFPFKIIKINKSRRNIVVSRRVVLEEERETKRREVLGTLEEGQVREGTVKNITDFGAFIDLGGIDGLLHITDMSWGRIRHPSQMVAIGDHVKVKVLNYDEESQRISLGLKQLTPYPWEDVEEKYSVGSRVRGKVVSITDYGAFVELEQGVEGLVHISEMSWTQHIRHPSKVLAIGDVVEAVVLNVDKDAEKISLGLKQTEPDPWLTLDERYPVGTRITGKVRNLTNFGAFVEIEEGIDGMVHISDMSWTKRIRHPSEVMKKGAKVEVVVLNINKESRRISLGFKQLFENPWAELSVQYAVGTDATGEIVRLLDRGVVLELPGEVEGFVPLSHLGIPGLKKPEDNLDVGDTLPARVIEFSEAQKKIVLSVRDYLHDREREEAEAYRKEHPPKAAAVAEVTEEGVEEAQQEGAVEGEPSEPEIAEAESVQEAGPEEEELQVAEPPQQTQTAEASATQEAAVAEVPKGEAEPKEEAQAFSPPKEAAPEVETVVEALAAEGSEEMQPAGTAQEAPAEESVPPEVEAEKPRHKEAAQAEEVASTEVSPAPKPRKRATRKKPQTEALAEAPTSREEPSPAGPE